LIVGGCEYLYKKVGARAGGVLRCRGTQSAGAGALRAVWLPMPHTKYASVCVCVRACVRAAAARVCACG